jgi:Methyltransferase domain
MLRNLYRRMARRLRPVRACDIRRLSDIWQTYDRLIGFTPNDIPGWMSIREQRALYMLGAAANGPLLEIGPWLGRSTVCIAQGIRDSGSANSFLTCELAPSLEHYREMPDGRIGFFFPAKSDTPLGSMSRHAFEREKRPYLEAPDGPIGYLKQNLVRYGLSVEVFVGDFNESPERDYSVLFADICHSSAEIEMHARGFAHRLRSGSILACHDTTAENAATLLGLFAFADTFQIDSLFMGELS